jgi:hypothetical protein
VETSDDLIDTVEDAIRALAQRAARTSSSDVSLEYAQAVNQLAEARAWLRSVSQPHGGSWHTKTTSSSS